MTYVPAGVRRQQFIDAAVTVIARDGVDGATTRRIAAEADAPLASLHYCFQTKENLLWAVFEQLVDLVGFDIERAPSPDNTVDVVAAQILRETARWGVQHLDYNRAQIEIWMWAERNDPAMAAQLYDKYIEVCRSLLRNTDNPLSEDRLETVIRVLVALVDGLSMQLITHGDEQATLREVETAIAMLTAFLRGPGAEANGLPKAPESAGDGLVLQT